MGKKTKLEQFLTEEELQSRPMRDAFADNREYHRPNGSIISIIMRQ